MSANEGGRERPYQRSSAKTKYSFGKQRIREQLRHKDIKQF